MMAVSASYDESVDCSLIARLFTHAEATPNYEAVVSPQISLSYQQLAHAVIAQADILEKNGVNNQSIVGIRCNDNVQHLVLCLAAIHLGSTSCTIPCYESEQQQQATVQRCNVDFIADEAIAINFNSLEQDQSKRYSQSSSARLLFSTSGTTGEPKLVVLHDNDLVAQAHRHISSDQERFLCLASIEHNFSKRHRLYCVAEGASNIFVDEGEDSLVAICQKYSVNVIHVSAFQARELLATNDISTLSGIRLKLGGSHVPTSLRQQLRNQITDSLQAGYGTTETGAIAFTDPHDENAGESVGQPLSGIEVKVVTPDRKALGPEQRGELAIRCEGMFRGYHGMPEKTLERLQDNWFYTGDIGYLDRHQRIHLCGRSDDMFVFNSINIYPQDIESQICRYPDIVDAAVLPKASPIHGSIPIALVVFDKSKKSKLPPLIKYVKNQVGIRCPRQFIIVEEIPRNANFKICRDDAINMSLKSELVRQTIAQALLTNSEDEQMSSILAEFEMGDIDITLGDLDIDSISRMDLLVALEVNHNTIITPQEFTKFRSLGNIVAHVLLPEQNQEEEILLRTAFVDSIETTTLSRPYVVTFFQRTFNCCQTVAQLNKAFTTLEHRLTPGDMQNLLKWHTSQHLIPATAEKKFHAACNLWFSRIQKMILDSGNDEPEPFTAHRVHPCVTHYKGIGSTIDKTLVICFSVAGGRSLMMPNAILMQHTDSAKYDLLVVSEPLNQSYRLGIPLLGNSVNEVIESLTEFDLINQYKKIRVLGCSAGCYPAIIAGYRLGAELVSCVGGRFHSERHPGKILERIFISWKGIHKNQNTKVLMSYDPNVTRDRHYAKLFAWLTGGKLFTVKNVGHNILEKLTERGQLAQFLQHTIFEE